jgi:hypothetical protein
MDDGLPTTVHYRYLVDGWRANEVAKRSYLPAGLLVASPGSRAGVAIVLVARWVVIGLVTCVARSYR